MSDTIITVASFVGAGSVLAACQYTLGIANGQVNVPVTASTPKAEATAAPKAAKQDKQADQRVLVSFPTILKKDGTPVSPIHIGADDTLESVLGRVQDERKHAGIKAHFAGATAPKATGKAARQSSFDSAKYEAAKQAITAHKDGTFSVKTDTTHQHYSSAHIAALVYANRK